jgi:hypothetical protein
MFNGIAIVRTNLKEKIMKAQKFQISAYNNAATTPFTTFTGTLEEAKQAAFDLIKTRFGAGTRVTVSVSDMTGIKCFQESVKTSDYV